MERYRNNGRLSCRAADFFDESQQSHIPRPKPSQQLFQEDAPAPPRSSIRKKRKTGTEDETNQSQAQSTHDFQPRIHASTDASRRWKDQLEPSKPLTEFQVTIGRKISELEEADLKLDLPKVGTDEVPFLDDDQLLYGWLTSNAVLPCLKHFQTEFFNIPDLRKDLAAVLAEDKFPFVDMIQILGWTAYNYADMVSRNKRPNVAHSAAIFGCAKYVRRLRRCAMAHFMHFILDSGLSQFEDFLYFHCARTIITANLDLENDASGFFGIMLQSVCAEPVVADTRLEWDKSLVLPGGKVNTAYSMTTIHAAWIAYTEARKENATAVESSGWDADVARWELEKRFNDAIARTPKILTEPPSENGQTEFEDLSKAGYPERKCDKECRSEEDLHTDDCHTVFFAALEEHIEYTQPSREAVAPDQGQTRSSQKFTFERSRFISPISVTKVFNYKNLIDPFTKEETLTAYKRFREVLKDLADNKIDQHFQWLAIAEVLPGRGVVDCIHFYYANKMQAYLKVKPPASPKAKKPAPQPQWSPFMEEEIATKVNETIDVDKFKEHIADLEEKSTSDRIKAQAAQVEVEKVTKKSTRQEEMIEELQREIAAMKLRVADK